MKKPSMAKKVVLGMAILLAELFILALIGSFGIDSAVNSCTFLRPTTARTTTTVANLTEECRNRMVFIYDLPAEFNTELLQRCHTLNPWKSMCSALSNSGLGPPLFPSSSSYWVSKLWREKKGDLDWPVQESWYATSQFSGEIIFHRRMQEYKCRTLDPNKAAAYFIPYYTGLDVSRYLWSSSYRADPSRTSSQETNSSNRYIPPTDILSEKLIRWLQNEPHFSERGGSDHFVMAGRISWDFRRMPEAIHEWGSSLFHRSEFRNVTRLVIERNPWDDSDVGVPYPTSFHPGTDRELTRWMAYIDRPRRSLFAFAGSPRPGYNPDFRTLLLRQCQDSGLAYCLDCSRNSTGECSQVRVTELFLSSVFCLQPRGDSYTRKSIFDSLVAGCVPVFFWNQSAYWQYHMYLPGNPEAYSVFIPHESVKAGVSIEQILKQIPPQSVLEMQREVRRIVPGILYASQSHGRSWSDAFDIAVNGVLERISSRKR